MRSTRLSVLCFVPLALLCASVLAQDVPLGDLVRQQKQQKEQAAKNDPAAKPSKVITDSDLPEHRGDSTSLPKHPATTTGPSAANFAKSAEMWKAQISSEYGSCSVSGAIEAVLLGQPLRLDQRRGPEDRGAVVQDLALVDEVVEGPERLGQVGVGSGRWAW